MPEEHRLISLLREEGVTLAVARHLHDEAGGGEAGAVAARRYMDAELRALAPWPSTSDYTQMAEDFGRCGQDRTGEFLRHVAAAGTTLEKSRAAWASRYAARGPGTADQLAAALRRADDFITWDPGGPYLGVDGAHYQPGALCLQHSDDEPVVIAESRGTCEVITGWADFGEMQEWIAGRGTGGSRALTGPPVGTMTRTWLEDTVLAYTVNHPGDAGEALRTLEPDAMTTDVRYEVLDAIRHYSGLGNGYYSPETISAEARSRLWRVPAEELTRYGGSGGPLIRTYVSRLAETEVAETDYRSAVRTLREEDRQARQRATLMASADRPDQQAQEHRETPVVAPGTCPEFPPGHVPGPEAGPVQGR